MREDSADASAPQIGIIGIGRMGAPIARHLSARFPVDVFDIDADRAEDVPAARCAAHVKDLAASAEVLVTVLPGPSELRDSAAGAVPRLRSGALWIDLTSGDPAVTRELGALAEKHGVELVSAPMGGSIAEAVAGDLTFFVSGADRAVDRALPILAPLAREGGVRRAGERVEDGQIVKLLANGMWFAHALVAAEAMLIGQGSGLAPEVLRDLLSESAGESRFVRQDLSKLLDGDYLATFGIDRVVEELDTLTRMAERTRTSAPLLDASAGLHREALDRFGPQLGELLAVRLLEDAAGRQLRR